MFAPQRYRSESAAAGAAAKSAAPPTASTAANRAFDPRIWFVNPGEIRTSGRRGSTPLFMMCEPRQALREVTMLHTRFCDLFEIDAPVLQAAIWPATTPELVAAVSEAGEKKGRKQSHDRPGTRVRARSSKTCSRI